MVEQKSLEGYFIIPLHIISLVVELTKVNCNKDLILFHGTLFTTSVFAILIVSRFNLSTVFCKFFRVKSESDNSPILLSISILLYFGALIMNNDNRRQDHFQGQNFKKLKNFHFLNIILKY